MSKHIHKRYIQPFFLMIIKTSRGTIQIKAQENKMGAR